MAKRFTDTDKWKKPWYRKLNLKGKILWQYLLDNCDHAGFIKIDAEIVSLDISAKYTIEEINALLLEKIINLKNDLYWIPKFIDFQYSKKTLIDGRTVLSKIESGEIHRRSAQTSIVELLRKNGVTWDFNEYSKFVYEINTKVGATKPLCRGYVGAKEMDKEMEMDKDKENITIISNISYIDQVKTLYDATYPRHEGWTRTKDKIKNKIFDEKTFNDFKTAIENYAALNKSQDKKYIKHFSTFFNCYEDYININFVSPSKSFEQTTPKVIFNLGD